MNKKTKVILKGLVTLFIIICILIVIFFAYTFVRMYIGIKKANTPITDIQQYSKIIEEWKSFSPEIVSHFPKEIPPEATNVDFYYFPGFLQSGSRIELRFQAEKVEIDAYYENFKEFTTKSWHGDTWVHRRPRGEGDSEIIELSKDFEIMQFDENPDDLPEHSKEHGVAISKEKNEIIFWAEW
ncbi:MAG: hypothetical protein OEV87_03185 [Phycisphaerae bacterium]|nr:hypothetical protein [Phycisphaerae bacterium]